MIRELQPQVSLFFARLLYRSGSEPFFTDWATMPRSSRQRDASKSAGPGVALSEAGTARAEIQDLGVHEGGVGAPPMRQVTNDTGSGIRRPRRRTRETLCRSVTARDCRLPGELARADTRICRVDRLTGASPGSAERLILTALSPRALQPGATTGHSYREPLLLQNPVVRALLGAPR